MGASEEYTPRKAVCIRKEVYFDTIERALGLEFLKTFKVTGLTNLEDGMCVIRLWRKIALEFD